MHLSAIGKQANLYWNEIPKHFPHTELGEFIIMPNHIHGIIGINKKNKNTARTRHVVSQPTDNLIKSLKKIEESEWIRHSETQSYNSKNKNNTVRTRHGDTQLYNPKNKNNTVRTRHVVSQLEKTNQFGKTIAGSLSAIIGQFKSSLTRWSRKNGYDNFAWQDRFHDHIIRNDGAFQRISNYIKNNPANWQKDKFGALPKK
ncbi:hypothetical protein L3073_11910 [Ancylomarina sp. DW003]|nr:transposase [Ancylomarina sp. DW003]MDE5422916.1 hypothetical protein [Ancylomarina sp. DW003]